MYSPGHVGEESSPSPERLAPVSVMQAYEESEQRAKESRDERKKRRSAIRNDMKQETLKLVEEQRRLDEQYKKRRANELSALQQMTEDAYQAEEAARAQSMQTREKLTVRAGISGCLDIRGWWRIDFS